jgi:hypothetical protein
MIGRTTLIREPYADASRRLSVFALLLLLVTLVLHRVAWLTTPVAMNLIGATFLIAGLALALGLVAATSIWVRGRTGAWSATVGLLLSGALWLWPAAVMPTFLALPRISDVTTSTAQPPPFKVLASQRGNGANSASYPGARVAALQMQSYPDLQTLVIPRSAEEVYEIILDLVRGRRGLGWKVVAEEAPQARPPRAGTIEATERTLILGFTDDIAIRVAGSDSEARVDLRSASRFGNHDFGANAARIRRFVRELSSRLDAAGPVGIAGRGGLRVQQADAPAAGLKRPIERTPEKAARQR